MGQKFLIDTNVVIDFSNNKFEKDARLFVEKVINEKPIISFINEIELLGFSDVPNAVRYFVSRAKVKGLNKKVVQRTIQIRKTYKTKLPDAIIAATALVHNLTLVTRNVMDFKSIEDIKIFNPWD